MKILDEHLYREFREELLADIAKAKERGQEPVEELPQLTEDEYVAKVLSEEDRQQPEKVSAVQRIYRLKDAEKLMLALKGSQEERAILIRDPNELVATAVLGSPHTTEAEIKSFAAMKNVSEKILPHIDSHLAWAQSISGKES